VEGQEGGLATATPALWLVDQWDEFPPAGLVFEDCAVIVVAEDQEVVIVPAVPAHHALGGGVSVRLGGMGVDVSLVPLPRLPGA
jgi:hypothetical protein